jgi:hypothetical protein
MLTIWKFNLDDAQNETTFEAPAPARVMSAGLDPAGRPSVWVEVESDAKKVERTVFLYGTGHPIETNGRFVGSIFDGSFVWHVYTEEQ